MKTIFLEAITSARRVSKPQVLHPDPIFLKIFDLRVVLQTFLQFQPGSFEILPKLGYQLIPATATEYSYRQVGILWFGSCYY